MPHKLKKIKNKNKKKIDAEQLSWAWRWPGNYRRAESRDGIHPGVFIPMTDSNKATNLITNCTSTEGEAKGHQNTRGPVGTGGLLYRLNVIAIAISGRSLI